MKKAMILVMAVGLLFVLCSCGGSKEGTSSAEPSEEVLTDWKAAFSEAGFSEDEISGYREVFDTIGVTDFHDVDVMENGVMHIVRGQIYDSPNLQLNVTLENRQIIYVEIAGIPDTKTEAYINWRGKLKTKTVDTVTSVEMFSDTEGGYLAVLDWENKTISQYGENEP